MDRNIDDLANALGQILIYVGAGLLFLYALGMVGNIVQKQFAPNIMFIVAAGVVGVVVYRMVLG